MYMPAHDMSGDNILIENSCHHQAINRVGKGLIASAHSADEYTYKGEKRHLIEGIETDPNSSELKGWPVIGVQFHPEARASNLGAAMAQWIVEKGTAYKQGNLSEAAARAENAAHFAVQEQVAKPAEIPSYTIESPRRLRGEDSIIARIVAERTL